MKEVLAQVEAECMGVVKSTMAAMAVGKFWDILENAFRYEEDPTAITEANPVVPDEEELPPSSQISKAATEREFQSGSKKRKSTTPSWHTKEPRGVKAPAIPLDAAVIHFPTHDSHYHYTGNPGIYINARKLVKCLLESFAECIHASILRKLRLIRLHLHYPPAHLGIALGCWICQIAGKEYCVYGGKAWMEHMKKFHGKTHQEAEFFKPAQLDLSEVRVADEISLDNFLHLLSLQKPAGVKVSTTKSATDVEVKLELPAVQGPPVSDM